MQHGGDRGLNDSRCGHYSVNLEVTGKTALGVLQLQVLGRLSESGIMSCVKEAKAPIE